MHGAPNHCDARDLAPWYRRRAGPPRVTPLMNDGLLFAADHPITLHWANADGSTLARTGRMHRVSDTALSVILRRDIGSDDALRLGAKVRTEAGDYRGAYVAVFHGSVRSVEGRLVRIKLDGNVELFERRRHQRVRVPFHFATAVRAREDERRYFLSHPVDIGGGGVRIRHRLPLDIGDRFQLYLRLKPGTTIRPLAEVIESWEEPVSRLIRQPTMTYVSRAIFSEITSDEQSLITRYVNWLLKREKGS